MTSPYDHEALWLKAKLCLNRAMNNTRTDRSTNERSGRRWPWNS